MEKLFAVLILLSPLFAAITTAFAVESVDNIEFQKRWPKIVVVWTVLFTAALITTWLYARQTPHETFSFVAPILFFMNTVAVTAINLAIIVYKQVLRRRT